MGTNTEALKHDIETTRAELGGTLDAIGDRVSPGRMVERRKNRIMHGVSRMRERVMGTADNAVEQVGDVPEMVRQRTEGAPMVAGGLAFGVGFLAAAMMPATRSESEMVGTLIDKAEPLKQDLMETGREIGEHLAESAKESADVVKQAATTGMHNVADDMRSDP